MSRIEKLMHDNLMAVFNERDDAKRQATTKQTYATDVRWTDAEGMITELWTVLIPPGA